MPRFCTNPALPLFLAALAFALVRSVSAADTARADSRANDFTIVVANGPHAGSYKPPADLFVCLHSRAQGVFTVAFKDFDAHGDNDLTEGGIEVRSPDAAGAKRANIRLQFGENKPAVYESRSAPVVLEIIGKGGIIRFDGATPAGIRIKITAQCFSVENA